jgi:hemerythrin superfamily protein
MRDATRLSPETSTTGTGDTLDELERDHRRAEQLFARASLVDGDARLALVPDLVALLDAHAAIEEDVVYPAIADAVGGGELLTDRHRAEHDEMRALLSRLEGADADDAELTADLRALQTLVQAHVAVEEGELFPAFRAASTPEDLATLAQTTERAGRRTPARPR